MNAAERAVAHAEDRVSRTGLLEHGLNEHVKVMRAEGALAHDVEYFRGLPRHALPAKQNTSSASRRAPASLSFIVPSFMVLLRGSSTARSLPDVMRLLTA